MRSRDLAAMLLLGAIWGGAFVLLRMASPAFGATALAGVRIAVAFLVLMLFLRHWRDLRARPLALFALGVINTAIPFWVYAYAMLGITSGLGALLPVIERWAMTRPRPEMPTAARRRRIVGQMLRGGSSGPRLNWSAPSRTCCPIGTRRSHPT